MTKQQRIDHFNHWPNAQSFPAEVDFQQRLSMFDLKDLFFPYQLPSTTNAPIHIAVSYLLDAVDSLPSRPDHAFDWTWRAFEYLNGHAFSNKNITDTLRGGFSQETSNYFNSNISASNNFFNLVRLIPFQTCEYLLKHIINGNPYIIPPGGIKGLSSYAKRLILTNGNPPIASISLQTILSHLSTYDYKDTTQRRNGASLLRRVLREETIVIDNFNIKLSREELLFFVISGLGYSFRNDRAHAKSIAPFRSSHASIKTYAHCWFMFLLIYESILAFLHTQKSPLQLTGCPSQNYLDNNNAFARLFADYLNA